MTATRAATKGKIGIVMLKRKMMTVMIMKIRAASTCLVSVATFLAFHGLMFAFV